MNDYSVAPEFGEQAVAARAGAWLKRKAPYLIVLGLAIFGVAYTSLVQQPLYGYWEFLGVAIGVACVAIGWRQAPDRQARFILARTQALHWAAFLVAMNIVLWPSVNSFLNAPATGLALLLLLALGTFVAGIQVSFDIAVLGLAMAVAVPAIAWFKQSALFLILAVIVLGALAAAFWRRGGEASA
ncbi:hypothetical protein [Methylosinus sp. LW3]|uniref:hypothetical protein n=1 Tax=Methylosinus sp. LW3 TaxID=107635 RepID=UPI00046477FE|nr:hypothetical protein [Methylosinus sp. LW3]